MAINKPADDPCGLDVLLSDLSQAQRAGVFDRSPVEAVSLLSKSRQHAGVPAIFAHPRWAVAAVVGLALISWSAMFSWKLGELRDAKQRGGAQPLFVTAANNGPEFFDCLSGPSSDLQKPCKFYDFDRDGDVDMSDWATHQQRSDTSKTPG